MPILPGNRLSDADCSFETGIADWSSNSSVSNAAVVVPSFGAKDGTHAVQITSSAAGWRGIRLNATSVTAAAGESLTVYAWAYSTVAGARARISVDVFTASQVFLDTYTSPNSAVLPVNTWTQVSFAFTAPSQAGRFVPAIVGNLISASASMYFDLVYAGLTTTAQTLQASLVPSPASVIAPAQVTGGNQSPIPVHQWTKSISNTIGTLSVPLSPAPAQGNALAVMVGFKTRSNYNVDVAVADDAHNLWTTGVASPQGTYTGATQTCIFVTTNARVPGAITVSVSSWVDTLAVTVSEFTLVGNFVAIDDAETATAPTASSVAISAAPGGNSDLLLTACAISDGTKSLTLSTFTGLTGVTVSDPNGGLVLTAGYMTSTSTQTGTYTVSSGTANASAAAIALRRMAAGPVASNPNWPALQYQMGFGSAPNDPASGITWTDITSRVTGFTTSQGRDAYELDHVAAGELDLTLYNADGAFSPANPSSPYYPNVLAETPVRILATWQGRTYAAWTGYVERWPMQWDSPAVQIANLVATDTLGPMSAVDSLKSAMQGDILSDSPYGYWPCTDASGSATAANVSDTSQTPLSVVQSKYGLNGSPGTITADFGVSSDTAQAGFPSTTESVPGLDGDSGSVFGLSGMTGAVGQQLYGKCLQGIDSNFPAIDAGGGITVEGWFNVAITMAPSGPTLLVLKSYVPGAMSTGGDATFLAQAYVHSTSAGTNPGKPAIQVTDATAGTVNIEYAGANTINDGNWHHWAITLTMTSINFYLDGLLQTPNPTPPSFTLPTGSWNLLSVLGNADAYKTGSFGNVELGHVAVHSNLLNPVRFSDRTNAGKNAFYGEDSGLRTSRILSWAGWQQPRAVDVGASVLQGATTVEGQNLVDALNDVEDWELGQGFVDSLGNWNFRNRTNQFNPTPKLIFGESTGTGEVPYDLSSVVYDYDPTYVYNDISITRAVSGGSDGDGQTQRVVDTDSQRQYFRRTLDRTIYNLATTDMTDMANWLLTLYSSPHVRIESLQYDPAKSGAWSAALGIEIGDAVVVNRRPMNAPMISGTYIVQAKQHAVDGSQGTWTTTLMLSPVIIPVITLDDPVYGIVGTNALGW